MTEREKIRIGKEIRAMDTIVRCLNDEELFMVWLMSGVADGDCEYYDDLGLYEEYYEDNEESFKEMVELFRNLIKESEEDGLYIGDVVA